MENEINIAVLIVDDNPIDTLLHRAVIEKLGYNVEISEYHDYQTFIDALKCNDKVDLVLLDIDMGDDIHFMDKVKQIQSVAEYAYILILTAELSTKDFMDASLAGCNGFVVKGFNVEYYLKEYLKIIYNKISLRNTFMNKVNG